MKRVVICLALFAGVTLGGVAGGRQAQAAIAAPMAALAGAAAHSGLVADAATVCGPYGCYYRPGPRYYPPRYYAPRRYYPRPYYYAPRRHYHRPRYYAPRPYYRPRHHHHRW